VGPQRDDVELAIGSMPARTHASQGEQRTLALALRLGAHRLVSDRTGSAPVLVLDDVLSELDPGRSAALLANLPSGQVVLTTASVLPDAAHPDAVIRIDAGMVVT
jgi:DNA replication and repair protein RecF